MKIREFFAATHSGDLVRVREMVMAEPGLLEVGDAKCFEYRALNVAVWKNNRELVDLLLELGADIDAADDFEPGPWTPLQHALNYQHIDLAEHLVARGATIDVHAAAGLPRIELLEAMLDADPERVHARGGDGKMPLHFAATPEVAELLLSRGAEIDARCLDHHSTPAQWGIEHRMDVVRYLVSRGAEPDVFMAAASGDEEWMRSLLDENPDALHDRVDAKRFPSAGGNECTSIYLYTLILGPDATPLHTAAAMDRPGMIDLLLDRGLDVNVRGAYDQATPLHLAAWQGKPRAIGHLLDRGATIDLPSGEIYGSTALAWAIVAGEVESVRTLLARGAAIPAEAGDDARAGREGAFAHFASAGPEDYEEILRLVESSR